MAAGAIVGALFFGLMEGITNMRRKLGAMSFPAYRNMLSASVGGAAGCGRLRNLKRPSTWAYARPFDMKMLAM